MWDSSFRPSCTRAALCNIALYSIRLYFHQRSWYPVPSLHAYRWGNNGNSDGLYFLSSKITADGDCSQEIKRCLFIGRKAMTNLDSILQRKDITLPTKVHIFEAMAFPIVMYKCESWIIKKTERRRIDVFELWCWRRLFRVPCTTRRSKQ